MKYSGTALILVLLAVAGEAFAQGQKFDFGPSTGPLEPGFTRVTKADLYSAPVGYGFTTPPRLEVDGSSKTWDLFSRIVTVDDAIPSAVLSDATRDCVANARPFAFRTEVPAGSYDVTLWLGDVTTPLYQVEAVVNGVAIDVERMDINHRRGGFDQLLFGNAVPRTVRIDAPDGTIEVTLGPAPDSANPITYTFDLDECPTPPAGGPPYTETIVPAYTSAALQAITIHPAADPPIVEAGGTLAIGSAPADPALQAALDLFNAGDIDAAREAFEALSAPGLRSAKAAGLFRVAGHPKLIDDERELLAESQVFLAGVLADNPLDFAAEDLLLQVRLADDAERYREALGYGGTPAAENLGRSCSIVENFQPDHPYYQKGRILWLRNRGGLDPRRCTASWERAQELARQLDPLWGSVNPYVHLYATDEWQNNGHPWTFLDWETLVGQGPQWAKTLVGALNTNLDLSEWWIIHRQNDVGEIGGGLTDDVELVGLFGVMAWLLEGGSHISLDGTVKLVDGIWNSGVIDRDRGYEAAYADVEHSAEPTGDSLHLYPMIRYGDPEGMERIMKNAKTFQDLFLTTTPSGHTHFKANHMSATEIGLDPNHRLDIPLNGRAVQPVPWLLWYSSNPGAETALRSWITSWVEDAARTEKSKPAGVFPNALVTATEEIGFPGGDWYSDDPTYGQWSAFPDYHYLLYNMAAQAFLRTGAPAFRAPFDALADYGLQYDAAGRPALGSAPTAGQEEVWCGGKLASAEAGVLSELARVSGIRDPSWESFLDAYASSYSRFLRNPTDPAPLRDVVGPVTATLAQSWPYRTTEGVMTDRIAVPGIADVVSYYLGADIYPVYFGLPVPSVTWSGTGRLFAAAVTDSSSTSLGASLFLFADSPRTVTVNLWGLQVGGDYVLEAGTAPGLGLDPATIEQTVPFTLNHRGDGPTFSLPGRTVYALRIRQTAPGNPVTPPLPDPAIAPGDISFDEAQSRVTVRVHNIGAADAQDIEVRLYEGASTAGDLIGSQVIPALSAPGDLIPRFADLVFPYSPPVLPFPVTVSVDPDDSIYEVTEKNNGAIALLGGPSPDLPPPMLTAIAPATTTPGGTVTATGRNFQPDVIALASETPTPWLYAVFVDPETLQIAVYPAAPEAIYLVSVENLDGKRSNLLSLRVAVSDSTPPSQVKGLRLFRSGADVVFSWDPVTQDVLGNPETVSQYEIFRATRPDFSDEVSSWTSASPPLTASGEATSSGDAFYRIRAIDSAGNPGD